MDRRRIALIALCLVQIVDVMGVTVVVAALPRMLADLGGTAAQAGLLVPVYAVGFGSLLLVAARLGDRWGHRRLLLAGLVLYAVGAALAAVAPDLGVLVAARGLQGAAAATSIPNALVLLTVVAGDGPARDRALGAWNACGGLAGALGLVVGGVVTTALGWRVIFAGTLLVAAALFVALLRAVPAGAGAAGTARVPVRTALAQVVGVAALVAAANALGRAWPLALGGLLVAGLAGVLVVRGERRAPDPLVPTGLYRRPGFLAGVLGSFGVTATTSSFVVLVTLQLQQVRGYDAAEAGLLILPFSVAVMIAAVLAGRLVPRLGPRRVLVAGLIAIGVAVLAAVLAPALPVVVAATALSGAGNGAAAVGAYAWGTAVPEADRGAAAGLLNTAAQLGTALVVALVVALASLGGELQHRLGWALVAAVAAVIIVGVLLLSRDGQRTRRACSAGGTTSPITG